MFFACPYSSKIWKGLVMGLLADKYSESWHEIMTLLAEKNLDKRKSFLLRYTFQNSIHSIWTERNKRRHGEQSSPPERLVKMIEKNVRNGLSTISNGDGPSTGYLQAWFSATIAQP